MRVILLSIFSFALFSLRAQTPARATPDVVATNAGDLTIQPIVHASLVLSTPNVTIYADPTGGAANYSGIKPPDFILITDIHGDHFDLKTINAVIHAKTMLVVPKAVADLIPDSLKGHLTILHNGDKVSKSHVSVSALPMYNLPEDPQSRHPKGRGNGYVVSIGGRNIYISGDTQGIPEMRALKDIDIAFVCMNLPYTMDVNEAADAVLAFRPKIVYPYHYRGQGGPSDVASFKKMVEEKNKNIEVRLRNWYPH